MSSLADFTDQTPEQIQAARPTRSRVRSPEVCRCGHSEGAHRSRTTGLGVAPDHPEICSFGEKKRECKCVGFSPVVSSTDVRSFRFRSGGQIASHPLTQGVAASIARDAEITKLDGWVCAATGCGATGQLYPRYFIVRDGQAEMPVASDTGHTFLLCALHVNG